VRSAAAGRTASEPAAAGTELGPGLTLLVGPARGYGVSSSPSASMSASSSRP
jgi:hypothetical protein